MQAYANSSDESSEDDLTHTRKRRRDKESAALGVFAESEDEGPQFKKRDLRNKMTTFVSAGQKLEEDEDDEMEDDEEDARPAFRGFATKPNSNPGTPLGKGFVPSSAATPVLLNTEVIESPRIARPSAFSTPSSSNQPAQSFAARMMARMGYEAGSGKGLGKHGQGRASIVSVQLRPNGVGLGAVKEKSKSEREEERRVKGDHYESSDEEKRKMSKPSKAKSGTSSISTPRRRAKYQTLADIAAAAPELNVPDSFRTILDLTCPGKKRLLTSSSGIITPTFTPENLEQTESMKLARRVQSELSAFVEEFKSLRERKAYVDLQILEERQSMGDLESEPIQLRAFLESISSVQSKEWYSVVQTLIKLSDDFTRAQNQEILSAVAIAAVWPLLKERTQGWGALDDPNLSTTVPDLLSIQRSLAAVAAVTHSNLNKTTPYESMIYKIIFPKISSAIQNSRVDDPRALSLFETWYDLLPAFVRSQIVEQTVVPKLSEAVANWRPNSKTHSLLHLAIFPWLQYLPSRHSDPKSSTGLVTDVKRKFRRQIDSWDFKRGVIPGLEQWRDVLGDQFQLMMMNHVIPAISRFLENSIVIEPQDQKIQPLQKCLEWEHILTPKILGQIIVDKVFPQWHSVLWQWLTGPDGNDKYNEIGAWYSWWMRDVFPDSINSLPSLQNQFELGNQMINKALDLIERGSDVAKHLPPPVQTTRTAKVPSPPALIKPSSAPVVELSFRDRVEDWCILQNDLHFLPEKKQLHSRGPLFRITSSNRGKNGVLVYFQGDKLVAVHKNIELPIDWESEDSRDALLEMANTNVK